MLIFSILHRPCSFMYSSHIVCIVVKCNDLAPFSFLEKHWNDFFFLFFLNLPILYRQTVSVPSAMQISSLFLTKNIDNCNDRSSFLHENVYLYAQTESSFSFSHWRPRMLSSFLDEITENSTCISATIRPSVELSNKASLLSFRYSLVEL